MVIVPYNVTNRAIRTGNDYRRTGHVLAARASGLSAHTVRKNRDERGSSLWVDGIIKLQDGADLFGHGLELRNNPENPDRSKQEERDEYYIEQALAKLKKIREMERKRLSQEKFRRIDRRMYR